MNYHFINTFIQKKKKKIKKKLKLNKLILIKKLLKKK